LTIDIAKELGYGARVGNRRDVCIQVVGDGGCCYKIGRNKFMGWVLFCLTLATLSRKGSSNASERPAT
jgi:hypothetical protein